MTPPFPAVTDSPLEVLERALRPALERPPCLVSFSGGRDSSAVLAVAAHVARREQLPLPVPASHRFPNASGSDESEWQERVVAHLQLPDWLRLEWDDELDVVGPIARPVLRRHGLLFPFNSHFLMPFYSRAAGGSVVTGLGGDELFGHGRWTWAVTTLRARPDPQMLRWVAFALAPRAVRRRVWLARRPVPLPWLTAEARAAVGRAWASEVAGQPLLSRSRFHWSHRRRYLRVTIANLGLLAAEAGVRVVHPLADPRVSAALARSPASLRSTARTGGMISLFGSFLPEDVLGRTTKAHFDYAFFARHSRAFADAWTGEGVDRGLVDIDALRAEWTSPRPSTQSLTLFQATWLQLAEAAHPSRLERSEEVASRVDE